MTQQPPRPIHLDDANAIAAELLQELEQCQQTHAQLHGQRTQIESDLERLAHHMTAIRAQLDLLQRLEAGAPPRTPRGKPRGE